jgi:MICOS complex subunit MIC60
VTITTGFYVGSTFVAFNNQRYYDFFTQHVPLGPTFLQYGEYHHWDTLTVKKAFESGKDAVVSLQRLISNKLNGASPAPEAEKNPGPSPKAGKAEVHQHSTERFKSVASVLKTNVEKTEGELANKTKKATAIARHQASQFSEGVEDLIRKAEAALSGKSLDQVTEASRTSLERSPPAPDIVPSDAEEPAPPKPSTDKIVYDSPLPIGFEPPPGYSRPKPPAKNVPQQPLESTSAKADSESTTLPSVTPAVIQFQATEPVIIHLASTIDSLASFLESNPVAVAKTRNILESAKADLTALANRIEKVREEEQAQLERKLDEQTREYTIKLLELEMEAQDKLDSQEEGFKKFFDEERVKFVQAYREKLNNELRAQTELINER